MLNDLIKAAILLEERMRVSPLHTIHATYPITPWCKYPTVSNLLFSKRDDMQEAMMLEASFAANILAEGHFALRFPNVPYLAIIAHYKAEGFEMQATSVAGGASLVMLGLEDGLTDIGIELCLGSGYSKVGDPNSFVSDLILKVEISKSGTIAEVFKGHRYKEAPLSLKKGFGVLETFGKLEEQVIANSNGQ